MPNLLNAMGDEIITTDDGLADLNTELLESRIAELELAIEDIGWHELGRNGEREFSRDGLKRIISWARLMAIKNPLIRRAVVVSSVYVWGQGVEVSAKDDATNTALQAFLDHRPNKDELFGHQARLLKDQTLRTTGNVFLVLIPQVLNGTTEVRSFPVDEIIDIVTNPDDRAEVWFYHRAWVEEVFDLTSGTTSTRTREAWYPDWLYQPTGPDKVAKIGPWEVRWDQAIYHIKVGQLEGMRFGVPEVYAALDWAKAYTAFLEDWATIVRSLSRFAWRKVSKKGKAAVDAARLNTTVGVGGNMREHNPPPLTGSAFVAPEGQDLTPISKNGATIDADSGKPLRLMAASALGLPDTILSGDVDQGNLATAKTLDRPTELLLMDRQQLWAECYRDLIGFMLDNAARSTQGPLAKTAGADGTETLADDPQDDSRTVDVNFPSILSSDIAEEMAAVIQANTLGLIPDEEIARLALEALGVEDIDELVAKVPEVKAERQQAAANIGALAAASFRRGEDPAATVKGQTRPLPNPPASK